MREKEKMLMRLNQWQVSQCPAVCLPTASLQAQSTKPSSRILEIKVQGKREYQRLKPQKDSKDQHLSAEIKALRRQATGLKAHGHDGAKAVIHIPKAQCRSTQVWAEMLRGKQETSQWHLLSALKAQYGPGSVFPNLQTFLKHLYNFNRSVTCTY